MSRRTLILVIVALVPVLVGLVAYLVVTDEEQIDRLAKECRRAFLAGDAEAILAHVDEGAAFEGPAGDETLRDAVRTWVERLSGKIRSLRLGGGTIEVDGEEARGRWLVTIRAKDHMSGIVAVEASFRRGPEGWRIRGAEVSRP